MAERKKPASADERQWTVQELADLLAALVVQGKGELPVWLMRGGAFGGCRSIEVNEYVGYIQGVFLQDRKA
jgi:hypothetical protein